MERPVDPPPNLSTEFLLYNSTGCGYKCLTS